MKKNGFTLLELLIVVFIIIVGGIGLGLLGGVCMGNFWVGEQSALKAIQVANGSVVEVIQLQRHVWGYSKAVIKEQDGGQKEFYLNSNILQNVSAFPAN